MNQKKEIKQAIEEAENYVEKRTIIKGKNKSDENEIKKAIEEAEEPCEGTIICNKKTKSRNSKIAVVKNNPEIEEIIESETEITPIEEPEVIKTEAEETVQPKEDVQEEEPKYQTITDEEPQTENESQILPEEGPLSTQPGSTDEEFENAQKDKLPPDIMGQETEEGKQLKKLLTPTRR